MKALVLMIIALFSNYTLANNWKEIIQNREDYTVRLSYTSEWLPATYGSEGGSVAGLFYVDIYGKRAMSVTEVDIIEEGSGTLVSRFNFTQDNAQHFYAQKPSGRTYADQIWGRKSYRYKVNVDGRIIEGKFKF